MVSRAVALVSSGNSHREPSFSFFNFSNFIQFDKRTITLSIQEQIEDQAFFKRTKLKTSVASSQETAGDT